MKKYFIISFILVATPSISFAFFCPTNFKQIDYGFTIDQVIETCGKPDSQEESKKTLENVPQEWSYFIPQTVSTTTMGTMGQTQGTLRTQIVFDSDGNAINISVNGIGVGSTTICGAPIQLGDKREAIKGACGEPSFINKQQRNTGTLGGSAESNVIKVTTMMFNSNPPMKLIFENGILKDRQ